MIVHCHCTSMDMMYNAFFVGHHHATSQAACKRRVFDLRFFVDDVRRAAFAFNNRTWNVSTKELPTQEGSLCCVGTCVHLDLEPRTIFKPAIIPGKTRAMWRCEETFWSKFVVSEFIVVGERVVAWFACFQKSLE